jgi:hypothetical protein
MYYTATSSPCVCVTAYRPLSMCQRAPSQGALEYVPSVLRLKAVTDYELATTMYDCIVVAAVVVHTAHTHRAGKLAGSLSARACCSCFAFDMCNARAELPYAHCLAGPAMRSTAWGRSLPTKSEYGSVPGCCPHFGPCEAMGTWQSTGGQQHARARTPSAHPQACTRRPMAHSPQPGTYGPAAADKAAADKDAVACQAAAAPTKRAPPAGGPSDIAACRKLEMPARMPGVPACTDCRRRHAPPRVASQCCHLLQLPIVLRNRLGWDCTEVLHADCIGEPQAQGQGQQGASYAEARRTRFLIQVQLLQALPQQHHAACAIPEEQQIVARNARPDARDSW